MGGRDCVGGVFVKKPSGWAEVHNMGNVVLERVLRKLCAMEAYGDLGRTIVGRFVERNQAAQCAAASIRRAGTDHLEGSR